MDYREGENTNEKRVQRTHSRPVGRIATLLAHKVPPHTLQDMAPPPCASPHRIRFPGCGSACRKPVSSSCTR